MNTTAFRIAAALLALCIFLFDILSPLEGAVAVLYVLVVLLAAATGRRGDILAAAAAGLTLTVAAYVDTHGPHLAGAPTLRALVSLAATGIATVLALKNQAATATLAAQARLLSLSHDMIFVRDILGQITFWNRAAEETYGWSVAEATGRIADDLLETRYARPRGEIDRVLHETGRWDGTLEHRTKAGEWITVESRWALQHDAQGRVVGVFETNTDVTERKAAHAALVHSERRYRRMFDASRIGVVQEDWSAARAALATLDLADGASLSSHLASHPDVVARMRRLTKIIDVNPAFLAMIGAGSSSQFHQTVDDVLCETDQTFGPALAAFARGDSFHEGETEIVRTDGRRVPVIFAITFPTVDDGDGNVLVFVVDITERRQAQDAVLQAQAELAHAARVATLGELTASIAHEVNQPLMAVVTNGEAALRWLRRDQPDLQEVDSAIGRVVSEGRRASEIVKRIRAFLTKTPTRSSALDVAALIEEAAQLVQRELARAEVELRIEVATELPPVIGDRIQLQQVVVNLIVNAGQAMAEHHGRRLLTITAGQMSGREPGACVEIALQDTGPGISPQNLERLFDPFFTTKPDGMGMGLAICRTTAEAHGGKLSVESPPGGGATFRLTLPVPQHGAPE
ncbi:PAS domain-containing sensor histidine kinase [Bosea sp. (in: a-proteobacteria)]|uniref:PAS domain-containing sensor histidine kinase n=1 Tax=Bosea sp. (in: a-proteobacteria) TaxID=1871050 RepID=UPI0011F531CB|nr:PAS domain-containing sensor histidine kinase [Bosea sp. (in: a-proteobacteria)]TAJ27091.1 MAG: PAS domain-containing sensor histidine kinase [Bosea sp. (in: a-proteobacteria)]